MSLPRDIKVFLSEYPYPDLADDTSLSANLEFYLNRRRCQPDNLLIQEIHEQWFEDYKILEWKHGFVQWLFPIREHGVNPDAQPLQLHEIHSMKANADIVKRLLRSYCLMLDFYGMQLLSESSGLVGRSSPPKDFSARYHNLIRSSHNNLRISRILKCMSELGLEHLNAGFLLHVLNEQSENALLDTPGIRESMDRWWANCLRDEEDREWLGGIIQKVRMNDGYTLTRQLYESALRRKSETGSFRGEDAIVAL